MNQNYVDETLNNDVHKFAVLTDHNYCVDKVLASACHKPILKCRFCDKSFSHRSGLYKHVKNKHRDVDESGGSVRCLENHCDSSFHLISQLRAHLESEHVLEMKFESKEFAGYEEFLQWKDAIEEKGSLRYVLNAGARECGSSKIQYFRCHRSGKYVDTFQEKIRKRKMKSQGSAKIGNQCTSTMTVTLKKDRCLVMYCTTHYGHTVDIEHAFITKKEKDVIASQLAQGVTVDQILESIRDSFYDECKAIQFITRNNLLRIEKTYGISSSKKKHTNDTLDAEVWVMQEGEKEDNAVILYNTEERPTMCLLEETLFSE